MGDVLGPYSAPPREASSVWMHSVLKQLQASIEELKLKAVSSSAAAAAAASSAVNTTKGGRSEVDDGHGYCVDDDLEVSDELVELLIKNQRRIDEFGKEIRQRTLDQIWKVQERAGRE